MTTSPLSEPPVIAHNAELTAYGDCVQGALCMHLQDALAAGAEVPPAATGVYVGCVWQEYQLLLEQLTVPPSVSVLTGSGMNFLIGRVSYTFGFQGVHSLPV